MPPKSPAASPSRLRPAKSPPRSRPKSAGKASRDAIEEQLKARSDALSKAREELGLLTKPLLTIKLFVLSVAEFLAFYIPQAAKSTPMCLAGYPLLAGWLLTHQYMPELYQEPGCGDDAAAAGGLYSVELFTYETLWWLVLGILSSIGFGSGLHSGIMFLWPFVMQVVLKAETCNSTAFVSTYNHPCVLQCAGAGTGASFAGKLLKVLPAAIVWGVGTALGELPPYFVTRAAKRAGQRAGEFEEELEDAKGKTDVISKLKVWTIDFTEKHGFVGVYLLASWPNAAFDMCGMACGWLEMPFWTFLGATVAGKGFTKVTIQCIVCIAVFSKAFFDAMMFLVPSTWLVDKAGSARSMIMAKFELQERFTADGLMARLSKEGFCPRAGIWDGLVAPEQSLDQTSLAQKYCSMGSPPLCGAVAGGTPGYGATWEKAEQWEAAKAKAARVLADLDTDSSGVLSVAELAKAQSRTDGKLSLASIDPGEGGLLSPSNLWNGFLAALILFFVVTIVEQVAKVRQNEADAKELEALEAELKSASKKKA